jgi:hypothetical protein
MPALWAWPGTNQHVRQATGTVQIVVGPEAIGEFSRKKDSYHRKKARKQLSCGRPPTSKTSTKQELTSTPRVRPKKTVHSAEKST